MKSSIKKSTRGAKIRISSASQAVLNTIKSYSFKSTLVWESLKNILQLAKIQYSDPDVAAGHTNIKGNEEADSLAIESATSLMVRQGPCFGMSTNQLAARFRLR